MRRKDTTNEFLKECMADALIRLMKNQPLDKITVKEITDTADVGRVTFYRNFESKEQLLDFKFDSIFEKWFNTEEIIEKNYGYRELLERFFYMILSEREVFTTLYHADALYVIQKQMLNRLWIQFEDSEELQYIRAFYSYGLYGAAREWIRKDYDKKVSELCDMLLPSLTAIQG